MVASTFSPAADRERGVKGAPVHVTVAPADAPREGPSPPDRAFMADAYADRGPPPRFLCAHCDASYVGSGALSRHEATHADDTPYPCKLCLAAFRTGAQLAAHVRWHAVHRPYPCWLCGRPYASQASVARHVTTAHSDWCPYPCPSCRKPFLTQRGLKRHRRLAHRDRSEVVL